MNKTVMAFVNGRFSNELSDLSFLPNEVVFRADEFFLHIPKNCHVPEPIHLLYLNTQNSSISNLILADENSHVMLIEEHTSNTTDHYEITVNTKIEAEKNARVNYYKIQTDSLAATHTAHLLVQQKQDSTVTTFFVDQGGQTTQENTKIHLNERGAACQLNGLYRLNHNDQSVTNHIHVDHAAAHGTSSMIYKGILDKKSRALFHGKVHVKPDAQQINAHQANHNLLLSADAEVSAKPELEIYADDVKCTHGATVGQLDAEALFYLRSRGIEKESAEKLLIQAFAAEMLDKIEQPMIRKYIQQQVGQHD